MRITYLGGTSAEGTDPGRSEALCERCGNMFELFADWEHALEQAADEIGIKLRDGRWRESL